MHGSEGEVGVVTLLSTLTLVVMATAVGRQHCICPTVAMKSVFWIV